MIGELVMYHTLAVPLLLLLAGLVLAFFGSRVVPFALVLCALILGFFHGASILQRITDNIEVIKYGPFVLAFLLALLVSFLYRAVFFLAGFFIAFSIVSAVFPELSVFISCVAGVIFGALVYASRNFVFSVLTALLGACLVATGIVNLFAWVNISAGVTWYWVTIAVTFIVGVIFQTKRNKGRK